ncbi:hypothetical protein L484_014717 [Morus notabilis]|uniref:Uncharacterized protein n=1 Tax=Morus notabilis TaxID=981085 RepID=W9QLU9_9ROSA|nr:hypothetical protein L484_014717 [Morus notabilis]
MTGEYGPSSSEILHGSIPNVFPSAPCESRRDSSSSSPSPPNCSTNLAANSSFEPSFTRIDLSSYKRIAIYPANKPIPDGSTSLPMRDDNWVAFAPPEATSKPSAVEQKGHDKMEESTIMGGGGQREDHDKMEGMFAANEEQNHHILENLTSMWINTPWECDHPPTNTLKITVQVRSNPPPRHVKSVQTDAPLYAQPTS